MSMNHPVKIEPNSVIDYSHDLIEKSRANDSSDNADDEIEFASQQQLLTCKFADWTVNQ